MLATTILAAILGLQLGPIRLPIDSPWVRFHRVLRGATAIRVTASQSSFLNTGALSFPSDMSTEAREQLTREVVDRFVRWYEMLPEVTLIMDRKGRFRLEQPGGPTCIWDGSRGRIGESETGRIIDNRNSFPREGGGWTLLQILSDEFGPRREHDGSLRVSVRVQGSEARKSKYGIDSGSTTVYRLDGSTGLPHRIDLESHTPWPSYYEWPHANGPYIVFTWDNIEFDLNPTLADDVFLVK